MGISSCGRERVLIQARNLVVSVSMSRTRLKRLRLAAPFSVSSAAASGIDDQAGRKRAMKERYARQPLFWRSFAYFCYRYFLKLGFLDGREGFLWHFMQGWWYRTLVDARQFEKQKKGSANTER
jgi:hypothetical protein